MPIIWFLYLCYSLSMHYFLLFEIIVLLSCLSKRVELRSCVCCISNQFVVRVIYSFAMCNIFWLTHRVRRCFIVSIYFIAISPASTLSVVLFSVTIVILIATFTIIFCTYCYTNSKCCAKVCKSIAILLIFFFLLLFIVCFTVIFVTLPLMALQLQLYNSLFHHSFVHVCGKFFYPKLFEQNNYR